jgi:hypothetical protein
MEPEVRQQITKELPPDPIPLEIATPGGYADVAYVRNVPRFAFGDVDRDPFTLFPEFMLQLRNRYPDYNLVWDKVKTRWAIFRQISDTFRRLVGWVERADGTYAEPSIEFLNERITATDWAVQGFKDPDEFFDALEKKHRDMRTHGRQERRKYFMEHCHELLSFIEKNPSTTILKTNATPEGKAATERVLNVSASGQGH